MFVESNPFTGGLNLQLDEKESVRLLDALKICSFVARKENSNFVDEYDKLIDTIESEIESAEDRIKIRS